MNAAVIHSFAILDAEHLEALAMPQAEIAAARAAVAALRVQ